MIYVFPPKGNYVTQKITSAHGFTSGDVAWMLPDTPERIWWLTYGAADSTTHYLSSKLSSLRNSLSVTVESLCYVSLTSAVLLGKLGSTESQVSGEKRGTEASYKWKRGPLLWQVSLHKNDVCVHDSFLSHLLLTLGSVLPHSQSSPLAKKLQMTQRENSKWVSERVSEFGKPRQS